MEALKKSEKVILSDLIVLMAQDSLSSHVIIFEPILTHNRSIVQKYKRFVVPKIIHGNQSQIRRG